MAKPYFLIFILWVFLPLLSKGQEGATLYKTYCSGCHGANMEGGIAAPLIKEDWQYGKTRGLITRNIRFGIPGTEMIGWKESLGNSGVRSIVEYIMRAQKTSPNTPRNFPKSLDTEDYELAVEVIGKGKIETPWGIEFVNEELAIISEQKGQLRWLRNGKLDPKPISGLPEVHIFTGTLGGLMDVALDPEYDENGWVYLAFSQTDGKVGDRTSAAMTKIIRGKVKDYQWTETEELFSAPKNIRVRKATRWGGRMLFDKEGYLFFSIGDLDFGEDCQDLSRANGKIFRIHSDGRIPDDNPFVDVEGALPGIYALGSRNAQGLALHPETGEIWATEHGPMGGDELNIIKKGANYGWPIITHGKNYDGNEVSNLTEKEGLEQPILHWTPSIAVCPIDFNDGKLFAKWKNNLFVGALAFEEVRRLVIEGGEVIKQEIILKNHGRIRGLKFGPDGSLYVLVNKPDAILRIIPRE